MAGFSIALALLAVIAAAVVLWFTQRNLRKIEARVGEIEIRSSQLKTLQDGLRNRQDELTEHTEITAAAESKVLRQAQTAVKSAKEFAAMRPQLDSVSAAQATLKEDVGALSVLLDKTRGYLQVLRSDFGTHAQTLSNVEDLAKVWRALDRHLHAFEKETDGRLEGLEEATATLDTDDMEDLRSWVDRRIDDHRRALASVEGELAARVDMLERTTFSGDTLSALGRRLEVLEKSPSWQTKVANLESIVRTELGPRVDALEGALDLSDRVSRLEARPVQGDLSPVVRVMQDSVANLRKEVAVVIKNGAGGGTDPDLVRELEARVARLEPVVAAAAEAAQERAVVLERIAHLEISSEPVLDPALLQSLAELESAASQPNEDLEKRLGSIAAHIASLEGSVQNQFTLQQRIDTLESRPEIASTPEDPELGRRLAALEQELVAVDERLRQRESITVVANGSADDLKRIRGVGPRLEGLLQEAGVQTLRQVAAWTPEDVSSFSEELGSFGKRIERDRWVEQAQKMVAELPPEEPTSDNSEAG